MARVVAAVATHLATALARLDAGELAAARAALLAAWTADPRARTSRLVELVDAKLDVGLPYPLANLRGLAALKAPVVLAAITPDPRVAPALLELLANPPWRANPSLPFWRLCCARIVATRDARILARLEDVALGYPKTIPTTVGKKVAGYLAKAAAALRAEIERLPPLDERTRALCVTIEAKLDAKPAKHSRGTAIASELLQAVYAAPADDGPRLVLADHLMQRGDARGEFINLQLARADGRADDTTRARELALLAASSGQWTGRIGMALVTDRFAFHRGFVAYAQFPRTSRTLAQLVDDAAWSTVELLDVTWSKVIGSDRDALATLLARSRGVRAVLGVPPKALATLPPATLAKLERIEVELAVPADTTVVLDWLARAARPRVLGIAARPKRVGESWSFELARATVEKLLAAPDFARLEQLTLHTHEPQTWLSMIEATSLPRLVLAMSALRVELVHDGGRFARALARVSHDHSAGFPEAIARHFANTLGDRELRVDARVPFYPGLPMRTVPTKRWPLLEGVVDDLALLGR